MLVEIIISDTKSTNTQNTFGYYDLMPYQLKSISANLCDWQTLWRQNNMQKHRNDHNCKMYWKDSAKKAWCQQLFY